MFLISHYFLHVSISLSVVSVPTQKWTDTNGDGDADPRETIKYSIAVNNTGSVSLFSVKLTSGAIGAESIECAVIPEGELLPNGKMTCFATYEVSRYCHILEYLYNEIDQKSLKPGYHEPFPSTSYRATYYARSEHYQLPF